MIGTIYGPPLHTPNTNAKKVQEQLWYFKKMLGAAKILNAPSISPSGNIITLLIIVEIHSLVVKLGLINLNLETYAC